MSMNQGEKIKIYGVVKDAYKYFFWGVGSVIKTTAWAVHRVIAIGLRNMLR